MAGLTECREIASRIADASGADVFLLNSDLERGTDREVIRKCIQWKRREKVILFLVTAGGDADVAYRIARVLQESYRQITVCVTGYCKSAGTLLVLGAHELAFAPNGELGPLDVQLVKKDELWESESGLTVTSALTALRDEALMAFEQFFLSVTHRSRGRITVPTAAEMAVNLARGLFAPITEQIDPMHMGEAWRSMAIGKEYGKRLMLKSGNFDIGGLDRLVSKYPSHGFVIDLHEASSIFRKVRGFTEDEAALHKVLGDVAEVPFGEPVIEYLSLEREEEPDVGATSVDGQEGLEQGELSSPSTQPERSSKPKSQRARSKRVN